MTPKSLTTGAVLVGAALLLPFAGWRLSVKAYRDDHFETQTEKLINAAIAGKIDTITTLLNSGVPVNTPSGTGMTPLIAAASANQAGSVKLLIARGADVNARYSSRPGDDPRTSRGIYQGASTVTDGDTPLLACARTGNADIARQLVSKGADVKAVDTNKSTTVSLAMQSPGAEMMRFLIEKGASTLVTDSSGDSPLMWAIQRSDRLLALAVIKAGGNVNVINLNRETALLQAARGNMMPDVELKLARTASDINIKDGQGSFPLSYAVVFGRPDVVKALLDRGADPNQKDASGSTPLINATISGNLPIVRMLIASGAKTAAKDKNGMTAMQWATSRQYTEVASVLGKAGTIGR